MQLIANNSISNSTLFITDGNCYTLYPTPLIHNLTDLRYNLRDKLNIANNIIHNNKSKNIKNLFSSRDKILIQQILDQIATSSHISKFLNNIISDNIIYYHDQPGSKISEIMKLSGLASIDNDKIYSYFYKWISFANKKDEKINTLINKKIYMPTPIEFNDNLDCQLHLHPSFIKELAGGNEIEAGKVRFFQWLTTDLITTASFSLHNPYHTDSSHMWGVYGDNGRGIAVKYALDDLIFILLKNYKNKNRAHPIMFETVKYIDNYNPGNLFRQCCNDYITTDNIKLVEKFWLKFTTTKSTVWEHEQELRFFKNQFIGEISLAVSKIINNKTQLGDEEFKQLQNIKNTYLNKEEIFILPKEFIFGWKSSLNELHKIVDFANNHNNRIPIIQLDNYIDYDNNMFYIKNNI